MVTGHRLRVLLVEDSLVDAQRVQAKLRGFPVDLVHATSLDEARERLGAGSFDAVLLDLELPGTRGVATYEALRDATGATPVLVLTSIEDREVGLASVAAGAQGCLTKDQATGVLLDRALHDARYRALERARAEHLNRVLRTVRDLGRLLVQEHEPDRLADRAVALLVRQQGYSAAWMALDQPDHVAWAGVHCASPAHSCVAWARELSAAASVPTASACGECPSGGHGEASLLLVPLRHAHHEYGVLGALLPVDVDASPDEVALFQELGDDLARALYGIEVCRLRHEAEVQIQLREQELAILYDQSPVLQLLMDTDARVLRVNQRVREYGLWGAEDPTGRLGGEVLRCVHSEHHVCGTSPFCATCPVRGAVGRAAAEGSVHGMEITMDLRRADGREVPRQFVLSAARLRVQEDTLVLVTLQDVSELLLLRQQLHHAQKMEAVGRLAGGVAHDFNNILSVILSSAGLIRDELRPSDPLREELGELTAAAERGRELSGQLLAFSRHQPIAPHAVDIVRLLRRLERMLHRLLPASISLEVRAPGTPITVLADPGQLEQVIVNLTVNARDAMPDGGEIHIELTTGLPSAAQASQHGLALDAHARVAVSDTGTGMTDEVREHVLEPFFTTKPAGEGTGLGLATAYGILRQHHGGLDIASTPGVGSTFTVLLPLHTAAPEPAAAPGPLREPLPVGGTECVLVVDDSDSVRRMAVRLLRKSGYTVLSTDTAEDALEVLGRERVDLVLTDHVMPGMTGRELRAAVPDLPVVLMSGYAESDLLLEADEHFLHKPFTKRSLLAKVRSVLDLTAPADGG